MKKFLLIALIAVPMVVVSAFMLAYFYVFNGTFSKSSEDWGNFGSFVGGLSTIIGLATFLVVLWTNRFQLVELRKTRELNLQQNRFNQEEAEKKQSYAVMELLDKQLEIWFDREFEIESTHPSVEMVTTEKYITFRKCLENNAQAATNFILPRPHDVVKDLSTINALEEMARLLEHFSSSIADYQDKFGKSAITSFYKAKYFKPVAKLRVTGYATDEKVVSFLRANQDQIF